MKRNLARIILAGIVTLSLAAPSAQATTGYFLNGYGGKARAIGGAGVAFPQDSMAPATNPAGLSFVGRRLDFGVTAFSPKRDGALNASLIGGASSSENSGSTLFAIPAGGVSQPVTSRITLGLALVANGGLSTRYNRNIYDQALAPAAGVPEGAIPNTGTLGVNLAQALALPTLAFKLTPNHSIGGSLVIGYQTFRAYGLGDFAAFGFSSDPAHLTNNGNDKVWGFGGRVGYTGKLTSWLTVGATYASKVNMSKFSDYSGLFAEQGDFDVPSNYAVGLAITPTPRLTFALDAQKIKYTDVASISNDGPTAAEFTAPFLMQPTPRPLGTNDGYGFGWDDIWVFRFGVNYAYNSQWTLRGGFTYNQEVYDDDQALFNILAPAVIRQHLTAGFTYSPTAHSEWTVSYQHAFKETQDNFYDTGTILGAGTGYSADTSMHQNSIGVEYAHRF
jgi:long-chain fatty acid transport protein